MICKRRISVSYNRRFEVADVQRKSHMSCDTKTSTRFVVRRQFMIHTNLQRATRDCQVSTHLERPGERVPEELLLAGNRLGVLRSTRHYVVSLLRLLCTSRMWREIAMSIAPPPATIESFFFALQSFISAVMCRSTVFSCVFRFPSSLTSSQS